MSKSYNLLDDGWIPVSDKYGNIHEVGLLEAFRNADDYISIEADEPMQTIAILRLMIASMYGAYRNVRSVDDWLSVRKDMETGDTIVSYLERYRNRFDLLDDKQPFYQSPDLEQEGKGSLGGLGKLMLSIPLGDREFVLTNTPDQISLAQAARNLVELQAWDVAGIKHHVKNQEKNQFKSMGKTGWCGQFSVYTIEGATLLDTLMLNFASPSRSLENANQTWQDDDRPVWERHPSTAQSNPERNQSKIGNQKPDEESADPSKIQGPATLMTWQPRRVRLLVNDNYMVTGAIVANGDRLVPGNAWPLETMGMWQDVKNRPIAPVKQSADKQLWRGLPALMDRGEGIHLPVNLDWLHELEKHKAVDPTNRVTIRVTSLTVNSQKAVINALLDDRLEMNTALLAAQNPNNRAAFENMVDQAMKAMRELDYLRRRLIECFSIEEDFSRQSVKDKFQKIYGKHRRTVWAMLDQPCRRMIAGIPSADPDDVQDAIDEWMPQMYKTFREYGKTMAVQAGTAAAKGRIRADGTYTNSALELNKYLRKITLLEKGPTQ